MNLSDEKSGNIVGGESSSCSAITPGNIRFPHTFGIYYVKCHKFTTSMFHLGEHQSSPQYAASFHTGWAGKNEVTLHNGPDTTAPVIGMAENQCLKGRSTTITIKSPPAAQPISELLKVKYHFLSSSYTFAVDTSHGIPEKFEWRQSHGKEVRDVDKWSRGWKLVRMTGDGPDSHGGKRAAREKGEAGDGKEVVAVLTDNSKLSRKMAKFQFIGTGTTGELGDFWTIMAVVTALRIWQIQLADLASVVN
ncbi:hypothetical protein MBLNU459_g4775t1 [Dothideomycetes sp. NU459]